jgi:hypothetical protein
MANCRKSRTINRWMSELMAGKPAMDTLALASDVLGVAAVATSVMCCPSVMASAV